MLCCFTSAAIPGMVLGCMAANLASFVSPWDFAIGTSATLLACLVTWFMSRSLRSAQPGAGNRTARKPSLALLFLVPLPTILFNTVIVGAEIAYFFDDRAFMTAWVMNGLSVGAGEAVVMYVLGVPLLFWMLKDQRLYRQLNAV